MKKEDEGEQEMGAIKIAAISVGLLVGFMFFVVGLPMIVIDCMSAAECFRLVLPV